MRSKQHLRFAIVGLGSIGRRHLRNLSALGYSDFLAVSRNICSLPKDDLPAVQTFEELDAALSQSPQVVFICNPSSMHIDTALKAAQAGCHLFLEKPISHSLDKVDELSQLVAGKNLCVQVGFQFRFHPLLKKIKTFIAEKTYGKLLSVHAHWGEYLPGWHPWEDYRQSYSAKNTLGGGVVHTLCHPFDYLRWLVGEVDQLYASGGKLSSLEIDTEDTALVNLTFSNGTIGSVYLDYVQQSPQHEVRFIFEKATITWDGLQNTAKITVDKATASNYLYIDKNFERNHLFINEVAAFLRSLQQQQDTQCSLKDGIEALRIALAVKQSMASKRAVRPADIETPMTVS
ncbi:MAG: Gfo/Idh/MocA family oxidoreductase [Bacteroidota bacterium]